MKIVLALALVLPALADATHARTAPVAAQEKSPAAVERLAAWPKPADKDVLLTDIERLVKARLPEMERQARAALEAAGASAVPFLLDRYGKERDDAARERLHEVLLVTTDAAQTRLLAKEFDDKSALTRTFALWRAAAFPDQELLAPAEAALARVAKLGDKAGPDEAYAAALCATAAGSLKGLPQMWTAALDVTGKREPEIRVALDSVRGEEASRFVMERVKDGQRKEKVAALNLLAGCGDSSTIAFVKPFLDDSDNSLRVAAINALRGIVDGEPPLAQLPVFEAIELAKKWKEKLL
ncbi:MAG: hypothetical protein ACKVWV_03165 [Planctomycetota bacterium]